MSPKPVYTGGCHFVTLHSLFTHCSLASVLTTPSKRSCHGHPDLLTVKCWGHRHWPVLRHYLTTPSFGKLFLLLGFVTWRCWLYPAWSKRWSPSELDVSSLPFVSGPLPLGPTSSSPRVFRGSGPFYLSCGIDTHRVAGSIPVLACRVCSDSSRFLPDHWWFVSFLLLPLSILLEACQFYVLFHWFFSEFYVSNVIDFCSLWFV